MSLAATNYGKQAQAASSYARRTLCLSAKTSDFRDPWQLAQNCARPSILRASVYLIRLSCPYYCRLRVVATIWPPWLDGLPLLPIQPLDQNYTVSRLHYSVTLPWRNRRLWFQLKGLTSIVHIAPALLAELHSCQTHATSTGCDHRAWKLCRISTSSNWSP